jgi:hypothetical protein
LNITLHHVSGFPLGAYPLISPLGLFQPDQQMISSLALQMIHIDMMALFIWLIIRLIQLVFSARTVFFSHKKSANSVFQPAYNSSRTDIARSPVNKTTTATNDGPRFHDNLVIFCLLAFFCGFSLL